jgi:RNA-directed DNA polymerase
MTSDTLAASGFWDALVDRFAVRATSRPRKLRAYRALVESGAMIEATTLYRAGAFALSPPSRYLINRSGGRKKTIYIFPPREELFMKGLNAALQPFSHLHSPLCHSFQRGRGVRTAYAALRSIAGLDSMSCLHLDVREYFASIPAEPLLQSLPRELADDAPLAKLLREMLLEPTAVVEGDVVADPRKGVLAGTPLAPLLANLYLRPLDDMFEAAGVAYLRYADDLIVFGSPTEIASHRGALEGRLGELGLETNRRKTRLSSAGEAWEFLGLRHERGRIDLASTTADKMRHRARRLARRARGRPDAARYVIRRLNRKLYGVGVDVSRFTWSTWFFPLIDSDVTLRRLDGVVQDQLRFAVTGRHERRNRGAVSYAQLTEAGYLPLVTAYRAYRRGPADFESLLERRLWPKRSLTGREAAETAPRRDAGPPG